VFDFPATVVRIPRQTILRWQAKAAQQQALATDAGPPRFEDDESRNKRYAFEPARL